MQKQDITAAVANGLKSSIHSLEVQVTILKQLMGGKAGKVAASDDADDELPADEDEDEEDEAEFDAAEDDAPKGKKLAKGKKADEDEEEEELELSDDEDEDAEEEEEDEEPVKKSAKGKKSAKTAKLTVDDVNDACKARVLKEIKTGRTGPEARKFVLKLLKTHHETSSIQELEPTDFVDVIKTLQTAKK